MARKRGFIDFRAYEPAGATVLAGTAATGADTTVTKVTAGPYSLEFRNEQANSDIVPTRVVDANCQNGWQLPCDNADNDGAEMTLGGSISMADSPHHFTVGTDAAFFCELKIGIPDISDYDVLFFGFREPAAYVDAINTAAACLAAYDEKAGLALRDNAGDMGTFTSLAGVDVNTDLGDTAWADDAVKTLWVGVSAAGAVTYKINGTAATDAVAFSFADATVVTPTLIYAKGGTGSDTPPIIQHLAWGLQ